MTYAESIPGWVNIGQLSLGLVAPERTILWCVTHDVSAFARVGCWRGWDIWCTSEGTVDPSCELAVAQLRLVGEPR